MTITGKPITNLPEAESVTNEDSLVVYQDGVAKRAAASMFRGETGSAGPPATINGETALTIEAGDNITATQSGGTLRISATNQFTDADALALETAGEKSNAAFSAIDDLLTALQVPVYRRLICNGSFHLNTQNGGKLDDFHVTASMAGQAVYVALMAPLSAYFDNENKHCVVDPEPVIRTATVAADGSIDARFSLGNRDYYVVVTTTDMTAHSGGDIEPVKILFTCRYTRNTGVFMGLNSIPAVSIADFADKLGYSLRYEQITDMTPEAVVTTTTDAVFLYDGSEYYELAATKPSEIPNQNAVYYRELYRRREL